MEPTRIAPLPSMGLAISLTKSLQFLLNRSIIALGVTYIALHQAFLRNEMAGEGLADCQ